MPHPFSFLFLNFRASSGNTSLQRSIMKVENMLFNAYSQHIPFLSPNHTHTQGSPHHEEQTVPCGHSPRRDSRQSTSAERPTWDFPTLSLRSHSPPGEASCTQQQEAPPLTRQSPSGHTAGPDPSPLRTEHPLLRPDLSPQDWEDSRVLILSEGSRLESTGAS